MAETMEIDPRIMEAVKYDLYVNIAKGPITPGIWPDSERKAFVTKMEGLLQTNPDEALKRIGRAQRALNQYRDEMGSFSKAHPADYHSDEVQNAKHMIRERLQSELDQVCL